MVPNLLKKQTTMKDDTGTKTNAKALLNRRDLLFSVPDAKDPVDHESPKEAEDHIGPRVPGIQLHEACSVQVQILVQTGKKHVRCLLVTSAALVLRVIIQIKV